MLESLEGEHEHGRQRARNRPGRLPSRRFKITLAFPSVGEQKRLRNWCAQQRCENRLVTVTPIVSVSALERARMTDGTQYVQCIIGNPRPPHRVLRVGASGVTNTARASHYSSFSSLIRSESTWYGHTAAKKRCHWPNAVSQHSSH